MKNTELDNLIRTRLLINYKNNKTLSENILTLKNKLLLEQSVNPSEITDSQLRYAYENNCLNTKTNGYIFATHPKNNQPALFLNRSGDPSKKGREYIFIYSDPNNPLQFAYDYFDTTGKQNGATKYSNCDVFFGKTVRNNAPDIVQQIDDLVNSKGYILYDQMRADQKSKYDLVDISTDPMTTQQIGKIGQSFYMWRPRNIEQKGLKQQAENLTAEAQKVIDFFKKTENWVDKPAPGEEKNYVKCDLSNKRPNSINYCYVEKYTNQSGYANYFQGPYILYAPLGNFGLSPDKLTYMKNYEAAKKDINSVNGKMDEENCRALILSYFDLTKYSQTIIKQEAGKYNEDKKLVETCLINFGYKYPKLSDVIAYLKQPGADKVEFQIANYDYSKKPASERKTPLFGKVKVENEIVLKNTISENLNKVKNQKNALLIESVIIKERLIRLVENNEFKTKRDLDRFSFSLLKESAYLNSKGYNENLVAEQWGGILGSLKGFFTGTGFDSIMQYFKEYAVGWLLKTIGLPDTGWIASFVKTAIGNLPLGDIGKLTNCDYTVPFLAKTIVESIIMKLTQSMKIDNAFTSVIRNALVEMGEGTALVQTIEKGLTSIVCPVVRQLSGKMGAISSNLAGNSDAATSPSQSSLMNSAQNIMKSAGSTMDATSNLVNSASRFTD